MPAKAACQAVSHSGTSARISRSAARWRVQRVFRYVEPIRRRSVPRRGVSVRASRLPFRGLIGEQPAHRFGSLGVGERQAGEHGDGFGEVSARPVGVAHAHRTGGGFRRHLSRPAVLDFRPVGTSVGTSVRRSARKLLPLRAFRAMLSVF